MPQSYSNGKKIYSVDMMFGYINLFKPKTERVKISDFLHVLEYKGWGDPSKNEYYSPLEVLKNPKKYKNEIDRIKNADLKYPIIINNRFIVDGVHRLCKAYLMSKKGGSQTMKAYVFNNQDMKKFLINNKGDWDIVDKLDSHFYIELFHKRFCNRK